MPARSAASSFSRRAPTASTFPVRVISPATATEPATGRSEAAEMIAMAAASPAEAPSLGWAPAGMCRWTSLVTSTAGSTPSSAALVFT